MVAVAQHHGGNILLIARVDQQVVVVGSLLSVPTVESLVDDHHAKAVAGSIEGCRLGIV